MTRYFASTSTGVPCILTMAANNTATPATDVPDSVDYIIVGGGQSGLVVASRLSEDSASTVLVVEAGADRRGDSRVNTPGMMTSLYDDPAYDWRHLTAVQPHANGRQIAWPRGKVLGGTSAMNFLRAGVPGTKRF